MSTSPLSKEGMCHTLTALPLILRTVDSPFMSLSLCATLCDLYSKNLFLRKNASKSFSLKYVCVSSSVQGLRNRISSLSCAFCK